MTINDKIRDEKLNSDISREAAKLSVLSLGEIEKKSDKLTFSPLGKALKKQTKTMEDQGKKQIKSIEDHEKRLVEFNELIKKDFNIGRDSIPLEE